MVHGRNFAAGVPGGVLSAIADPNPDVRASTAAELGVERTFEDPRLAVTDHDIDAVVIAAPTALHAELAVLALDAGKHVLCEKPLAASVDHARDVVAAAERSSAHLLMGFMRRFDAGFMRAAERVSAGDIGVPLMVRSTGRGPGLPPEWAWDTERSGGLLAEVNSHDIDSIRWLSGQEISSAYVVGRAAKHPEIAVKYPGFVDVLVATFELSGGGLAQLDGVCPSTYGYDARVEVLGTEGTLLIGASDVAGAPVLVRNNGAVVDTVSSWRTLFDAAYREEDRHLIAVANGEEEPRTCADDGLQTMLVVIAGNRSLREGRAVEVSQNPGEA